MQSFENLSLSELMLKGVKEAGFTVPSPIQVETIPEILKGRDVVAQAHTGTGKTAAFGLPLMSKLKKNEQILIITPTRELAMQVSDELFKLGKYANIKTAAICGGQSYTRQRQLINEGAQVVSATPGRLLDLLSSGRIKDFKPKYVVLDEADEMLDMGFLEDIRAIFEFLPADRQTLLFSATIPRGVERLAETLLKNPFKADTKGSQPATNADIEEHYFVIEEYERNNSLIRLIDFYEPTKSIIFTRTKKDADNVSTSLVAKGYPAKCLHGDLSQPQREEVTRSFRKGDIAILVATDVAARGLDIADVSHVFNYHLPFDPDSYVHRVGRTGRAGNKGTAITFVTPQEYRGLTRILKATGSDITYRQVPTLTETNENLIAGIVEKVRNAKQDGLSRTIVDVLSEDMNLEEIALSLASLVWSNEEFSGPEKIGVDGQKLQRLKDGAYRDSGGGDRNRGRSRGRGGPRGRGDNRGGSSSRRGAGGSGSGGSGSGGGGGGGGGGGYSRRGPASDRGSSNNPRKK